jgi:3-oxoacyl-[acyl-carrier protein] reductase
MTPMTAWLTDDLRSGIEKATPLGRTGMPDDIADAFAFLPPDSARWITGRTSLADGGPV